MINLICLMDLILFLIFKIILSISSKNCRHETIADNPPVQIYVNKIKTRIIFKIKIGYKLELLTKETMQLSGSSKKALIKTKVEKLCQD